MSVYYLPFLSYSVLLFLFSISSSASSYVSLTLSFSLSPSLSLSLSLSLPLSLSIYLSIFITLYCHIFNFFNSFYLYVCASDNISFLFFRSKCVSLFLPPLSGSVFRNSLSVSPHLVRLSLSVYFSHSFSPCSASLSYEFQYYLYVYVSIYVSMIRTLSV